MKRVLACVAFLAVFISASVASAQATPNRSGFGIGLGEANLAWGISMKGAQGATAWQVVAGGWSGPWFYDYRYGYADGLAVAFDFLFEQPTITEGEPLALGWNAGLGAGVGIAENSYWGIGLNGVVGLEFNFKPVPIDVTLEYRPGVYFHPNDFDLALVDFGGHVRFWF